MGRVVNRREAIKKGVPLLAVDIRLLLQSQIDHIWFTGDTWISFRITIVVKTSIASVVPHLKRQRDDVGGCPASPRDQLLQTAGNDLSLTSPLISTSLDTLSQPYLKPSKPHIRPKTTSTSSPAKMFNFLHQLLLFTLFAATEAAPTYSVAKDYGAHIGGSITAFIVLVLDIIVWSKSFNKPIRDIWS